MRLGSVSIKFVDILKVDKLFIVLFTVHAFMSVLYVHVNPTVIGLVNLARKVHRHVETHLAICAEVMASFVMLTAMIAIRFLHFELECRQGQQAAYGAKWILMLW